MYHANTATHCVAILHRLGLTLRNGTEPWQILREHDQSLMDYFGVTGFSPKELQQLNLC